EFGFFIFRGVMPKNFLSSGVLSFGKLFHTSRVFDGSFSWNWQNVLCIILAYPSQDL
ncbi:8949_t:CDS:1, partial [Ambispora gerdemannii]